MTDQTDKAMKIGRKLVELSDRLMKVMEEARAVKDEKESSGIDLTAYNVIYADNDLRHVDGTNLNNCISSFAAFETWATTNFHDDIWQTARN